MKKTSLAAWVSLAFLATILVILGSWLWHGRLPRTAPEVQPPPASEQLPPLDYTSHTLQNQADVAPLRPAGGRTVVAGITSHHLPVAEEFIGGFYAQLRAERPDISEFVVAGPDHFEHCRNLASVTVRDFSSPFGLAANDRDITAALLAAGAGEDNACFEQEHSVAVEITFIKKYFPNARVAGVLFSSVAPAEISGRLAAAVAERFPSAVVIGSTDFSHYESKSAADRIDERTQRQIEGMDTAALQLEQLDSPATLRFAAAYAKRLGASAGILGHANSYDFTGQQDNTTSYFNVLFEK